MAALSFSQEPTKWTANRKRERERERKPIKGVVIDDRKPPGVWKIFFFN